MIWATHLLSLSLHLSTPSPPFLTEAHKKMGISVPEGAPVARKCDYTYTKHGETIPDEFSWMREKEWPEKVADTPEIIAHLNAENAYFEKYMAENGRAAEKERFFEELKGRVKLADQSTYRQRGEFFIYDRSEETSDYKIHCRKRGSTDAPEEVILDVNKLAEGKSFCRVSSPAYSPDDTLITYAADYEGGETYTLYLKDIASGELREDKIEKVGNAGIWHKNGEGFFYLPVDEKWRRRELRYHKLGTPVSEDKKIYFEEDTLFSLSAGRSSSKEYLIVEVSGHATSEFHAISFADPEMKMQLLLKREDPIKPNLDHTDGAFYASTNADDAKNFKVIRAESEGFDIATSWKQYRAEDDKKCLESMDVTDNYMLLSYNNAGLPELVIHHLKSKAEKRMDFPDISYTASLYSTNAELDDIRVSYASLARPSTVYSYNFDDASMKVLKVREIPSGFNPDEYTVARIYAKTDGVEVPMSILHRKDTKLDGSATCYLEGYGSYGISSEPGFFSTAVSIANLGMVYAIGHIRGGSDLGNEWYETAKFLNKRRTFNDFMACADELIAQKFTSQGEIIIRGGSAGGMLMGVCQNERPELYKGIISHVPFVDVLQVMLDKDLPLTPGEWKEWGNPEDPEYFKYMKSYSPYDNIKQDCKVPHLFFTSGLNDPRVGYWEASKFVARVRDRQSTKSLVVLKTNMDAGHGGASGRFDYLKEVAEELVFVNDLAKKEK